MADATTSQYYTIVSSEDTCNVGDTIYINKRTYANSVTLLNENSPFYFFEDGILIETISFLDFTTFGYDYTPSSSGVHEVFMAQDWGTGEGYTNSNILTITVTDTTSNVGLVINNKTVQNLSINGKTVQSIKDLITNKIIYEKQEVSPIEPVLYDKIRHVFIIEEGSDAIVEGQEYLLGSDNLYYDDSVTLDTVEGYINEFEETENLYIYYDGIGNIDTIEDFYTYGYLSDNDYHFEYDIPGLYYNGYDGSLGALIFTQVLSETGGILWFLIDSKEYFCLDCSISNDDSNQVTVFTWTIPIPDMIYVDNVSATFINITLHDFRISGNYTCNVFDAMGKNIYSNDRIRTDPFSFRTSVLTFPVTIYLFDSTMKLLQTKTVEFENNNENPK